MNSGSKPNRWESSGSPSEPAGFLKLNQRWYLVPVLLGPPDVLFGVDPVQLLVQRVVVDGADVLQVVDGQDDVRALLLVDHHPVDGRLLAEEQERCGSCREQRQVVRDEAGPDQQQKPLAPSASPLHVLLS